MSYTHAAEQVVLQVEGDIAVLLDGAEDLGPYDEYWSWGKLARGVLAHFDSLGGHLCAR